MEGLNKIRINRTDVGMWGPACVQHGFIQYPSFNDPNFKVPSNTGITLEKAIVEFMANPK